MGLGCLQLSQADYVLLDEISMSCYSDFNAFGKFVDIDAEMVPPPAKSMQD